jgi:hypothetical protein
MTKNKDKTRAKKKGGKRRTIKNQIEKRRKDNKTLSEKGWINGKNFNKKTIKEKKPKVKVLAHELLASTLSCLMLAPRWYSNPSNPSSRTPHMSSMVFLCISFHY